MSWDEGTGKFAASATKTKQPFLLASLTQNGWNLENAEIPEIGKDRVPMRLRAATTDTDEEEPHTSKSTKCVPRS